MNKLAKETSPYLLQHAHNPVDWYPWGEEALMRARKEDKPILVSIGYATCHWCHVMEKESFEDHEVAAYMNEHFINIKVDREERPDLDHIYMMAVQILSGAGGWPLNCFLTPDGRPFFGGTYYPPMPAHNRPSWFQLLLHLKKTYDEKREVVESQANRITESIKSGDKRFFNDSIAANTKEAVFDETLADQLFEVLQSDFDNRDGGFGGAPKFPGTMTLDFLLAYHHYHQKERAFQHVLFSLSKMVRGGIYDQLGGGFARYATDNAWLIPHFEKMLYDNALLTSLMSATYKVAPRPWLERAIRETLSFIKREMTNEAGGFFSALDSDSEGEEGKFYIWSKAEVEEVLGEDANLFCEMYDVTVQGNWEGKNILHRNADEKQAAARYGLTVTELEESLEKCRQLLLKKRNFRVRPGLDDKILLGWNALMATAHANAWEALGDEAYRNTCLRNLDFLWDNFRAAPGILHHSYKDGYVKGLTFLDDYAFFIEALLAGFAVSNRLDLLEKASELTAEVIEKFGDSDGVQFFFTAASHTDVLLRKKEVYDAATPSGNAVMAENLQKLGILLDIPDYTKRAFLLLNTMKDSVSRFPSSFSRFARQILHFIHPPHEVAVVGPDFENTLVAIHRKYLPGLLLLGSDTGDSALPLLAGKTAAADGRTAIYVCQNYACLKPVYSLGAFEKLIE